MISLITYYILEVLFGTTYWILYKSTSGIYYIIQNVTPTFYTKSNDYLIKDKDNYEDKNKNYYGNEDDNYDKYKDTVVISKADLEISKNKLNNIIDKINEQNNKIVLLNESIGELRQIIKKNSN